MILGADVSWVSQLEDQGYHWVDAENRPVDPLQAAKDLGVNAIRLRVFVDPPKDAYWQKPSLEFMGHQMPSCTTMLGYCDKNSIAAMAKRVQALGLALMIDLHYSDHFADPIFQDIPDAWRQDTAEQLVQRVAQHTEDVLRTLLAAGVTPDQVQVGNEINAGILLPLGSAQTAPDALVQMLNAGYDAVKRLCPQAAVVTHVSYGHDLDRVRAFFDPFFARGGKTDQIGLSYYPAWFGQRHKPAEFYETLCKISDLYQKPFLLSEIGGHFDDPDGTYDLLADTLQVLDSVLRGAALGMYYWEPEVADSQTPDHYPLGAAQLVGKKTLQYTRALRAYRDFTGN